MKCALAFPGAAAVGRPRSRSTPTGQQGAPGWPSVNGIVQVLEGFVEAKDNLIEMDANPLGSERASAATFGCNGLQSNDAQSAKVNLLPAALLGALDADVDEPLTVAGESRRDQEREGFLFGHVVRVPQPGGTRQGRQGGNVWG